MLEKSEEGNKLINLQIQVVLDGDVLALPVYNRQGCLLLSKGATISEQNRSQLRNHGVNQVVVMLKERKALVC